MTKSRKRQPRKAIVEELPRWKTPLPPLPVDEDGVHYPTSDGKPLAETGRHVDVLVNTCLTLQSWMEAFPNVYLGSCNFLYYERGNPRKVLCPDIYLTFGIPKEPPRECYKVWVEGKGPDVVIELTSRATAHCDRVKKMRIYRDVLKVREYFLFDPKREYLRPPEKGYRRVGGAFVPIKPVDGRLPSELLELHLEREDWHLHFYNPKTKHRLLPSLELWRLIDREKKLREEAHAALEKLRCAFNAFKR